MTNGNDYVHPRHESHTDTLTKRELIAKDMMAALLQAEYDGSATDVLMALDLPINTLYKRDYYYQLMASDAIIAADTLIQALNKQP